jgi:hypothetical protein
VVDEALKYTLRFRGADGSGFDCVAALPLEFRTLVNASRTSSLAGLILASAVVLGTATPVAAQNYAPPPGAVIDLSAIGGPIPLDATLYTSAPFSINEADVVGGFVQITFAFRNDSFGLVEFWGAGLFDVKTPDVNLLVNGNFNNADSGQKASHWNYTPRLMARSSLPRLTAPGAARASVGLMRPRGATTD